MAGKLHLSLSPLEKEDGLFVHCLLWAQTSSVVHRDATLWKLLRPDQLPAPQDSPLRYIVVFRRGTSQIPSSLGMQNSIISLCGPGSHQIVIQNSILTWTSTPQWFFVQCRGSTNISTLSSAHRLEALTQSPSEDPNLVGDVWFTMPQNEFGKNNLAKERKKWQERPKRWPKKNEKWSNSFSNLFLRHLDWWTPEDLNC